jgi:hypothetical protein
VTVEEGRRCLATVALLVAPLIVNSSAPTTDLGSITGPSATTLQRVFRLKEFSDGLVTTTRQRLRISASLQVIRARRGARHFQLRKQPLRFPSYESVIHIDGALRWYVEQGLWSFRVASPYEFIDRSRPYSVKDGEELSVGVRVQRQPEARRDRYLGAKVGASGLGASSWLLLPFCRSAGHDAL